jgi:hypothetical protein
MANDKLTDFDAQSHKVALTTSLIKTEENEIDEAKYYLMYIVFSGDSHSVRGCDILAYQ